MNKSGPILKKIAGIGFAIAFLMAIVLFTGYGRNFISTATAKNIFLVSGAIGLLFNLFSFQSGQASILFNFLYWTGSIVLFGGLTFLTLRLPYGFYIIIAGMVLLGISFIVPEKLNEDKSSNDILDDL
tara:strand:+ start:23169 stop:23552 length:384 start_codon:yes stop_codon:yes gene_type:complete